jgi:hypothetical protein
MPKGFTQDGKVLKLNKSLHGLKQSPRNHFKKSTSILTSLGFKPRDADPCLFVFDKCICLVYLVDTLLYAQNSADIDAIVQCLKRLEMDLEEEDDVAGFLGVLVHRTEDGTNELLQIGLIVRTIAALHINHLPNGSRTSVYSYTPSFGVT